MPAASPSIVLALILVAGDRGTDVAAAGDRVRLDDRRRSPSCCSTTFVLPFEVVSVLLLAAVIGGVFLAKRERGDGTDVTTLEACTRSTPTSSSPALLFAIGTFGFLARRNAISMLMSIELMLNAVNLAIVAFGAFIAGAPGRTASVIALMVMAVAAAEATVGLAIVIAIYRNRKTPLVDEYDAMRRVSGRSMDYRDCSIALHPVLPLAGFVFSALVGRRLQAALGSVPRAHPGPGRRRRVGRGDGASSTGALRTSEPFGEHGFGFTLWDVDPRPASFRSSRSASSSTA